MFHFHLQPLDYKEIFYLSVLFMIIIFSYFYQERHLVEVLKKSGKNLKDLYQKDVIEAEINDLVLNGGVSRVKMFSGMIGMTVVFFATLQLFRGREYLWVFLVLVILLYIQFFIHNKYITDKTYLILNNPSPDFNLDSLLDKESWKIISKTVAKDNKINSYIRNNNLRAISKEEARRYFGEAMTETDLNEDKFFKDENDTVYILSKTDKSSLLRSAFVIMSDQNRHLYKKVDIKKNFTQKMLEAVVINIVLLLSVTLAS